MHFAFGPNGNSGSIRRHRNPDTKRRHGCSELPKLKVHNGRAAVNNFMRAHKAELFSGAYDISVGRTVFGWDPGDPVTQGNPILVRAIDEEVDEPYPDIPDWVWDQMYADTLGICGPLCDPYCHHTR